MMLQDRRDAFLKKVPMLLTNHRCSINDLYEMTDLYEIMSKKVFIRFMKEYKVHSFPQKVDKNAAFLEHFPKVQKYREQDVFATFKELHHATPLSQIMSLAHFTKLCRKHNLPHALKKPPEIDMTNYRLKDLKLFKVRKERYENRLQETTEHMNAVKRSPVRQVMEDLQGLSYEEVCAKWPPPPFMKVPGKSYLNSKLKEWGMPTFDKSEPVHQLDKHEVLIFSCIFSGMSIADLTDVLIDDMKVSTNYMQVYNWHKRKLAQRDSKLKRG